MPDAAVELRLVPLDQLRESPRNPRRHYDDAALDELATSLQQEGQMAPCLARPHPDGQGVELAAGHRRRRAAERAGLPALLCLVRPMTDEQFLRMLVRENQDRADLHPLDEAMGFRELLGLPGYDVAAVAAAVGKSTSYVYGRLHLVHLIDEAQERFLRDEFPVSHALVLARCTPDDQPKALELLHNYDDALRTLEAFRAACWRAFHAEMEVAPWDLDDATLLPSAGACTGCVKRSTTTPDLFGDVEEDVCTDRACYERKRGAHIDRAITTAREAGRPLVQIVSKYREALPRPGKPVTQPHWTATTEEAKGAKAAIDVESGDVRWVKLKLPKDLDAAIAKERETQKQRSTPASTGARGLTAAEIAAENAVRDHLARQLLRQVASATSTDATKLASALVHHLATQLLAWDFHPTSEGFPTPHLEVACDVDWGRVGEWLGWAVANEPTIFAALGELRDRTLDPAAKARLICAAVLSGGFLQNWHNDPDQLSRGLVWTWVAGLLGVDLDVMAREYEAGAPAEAEPKPTTKKKKGKAAA